MTHGEHMVSNANDDDMYGNEKLHNAEEIVQNDNKTPSLNHEL
jgi:hypothetical protein